MTTTTTRRAMLAGTAALPALATAPALADILAPAPDPIFAALAAFHRAWDATEAWDTKAGDIPDDLMTPLHEAKRALLDMCPTTPAGLAALTECVRNEWRDRETSGAWNSYRWLDEDLETLTVTIDDAVRGMSGLAPWSPPAVAAPGNDPIFAAIETHRKAMAACHAAVAVSARLEDDTPEHTAAQAVTDRATDELDEAGIDLADIEPTTTAGLLALLAHVIGCIEAADGDGLDGDRFDGGNWRLPHTVGADGDEHFMFRLLCSIEHNMRKLAGRA